jgi:membrane protein DedA with SNARE-associated domain
VLLARVCSDAERARADTLVRRWGVIAVAASRPIPVLAETIMVAAGASRLGVGRTVLAAALGALPASVMFPVAGALGADGPTGWLVFAAAIATSILLWLIGRRLRALR